jgi:hypothetical protein
MINKLKLPDGVTITAGPAPMPIIIYLLLMLRDFKGGCWSD